MERSGGLFWTPFFLLDAPAVQAHFLDVIYFGASSASPALRHRLQLPDLRWPPGWDVSRLELISQLSDFVDSLAACKVGEGTWLLTRGCATSVVCQHGL